MAVCVLLLCFPYPSLPPFFHDVFSFIDCDRDSEIHFVVFVVFFVLFFWSCGMQSCVEFAGCGVIGVVGVGVVVSVWCGREKLVCED